MWLFLSKIILRYRYVFLLLLLGATAFMGFKASRVELSYELARLLPETDKDYIDYLKFKEIFGEDGSVLAIAAETPPVGPSDIYQLDNFKGWYDLSNEIKKIDGIEQVVSTARLVNIVRNDSVEKLDSKPVTTQKPSSQEEVDSIKKIVFSLPFYDGFLYNKESGASLMMITLDQNKLNTKNRIALVDSIKRAGDRFSATHHIRLHYSGLPYVRTSISRTVLNEMMLFLGLAVAVTGLILLIFFRSFVVVFFSMIVVVIGVIWSFGSMALFHYKITVLSGLIPPLIIVIGIPNCILLLNKYHEEFRKSGNKMRSLTKMIQRIGITTLLANLTTAIGFGVFYFTQSNLLMEFGIVAALNVMATYLISLFLIPIVFSFLPEPSGKSIKHLTGKFVSRILNRVDYWVHHKRTVIYTTVGVIILISLYGMSRISTVGYVVDDLSKNDPVYVDMKYIETNFGGVLPFEIWINTKKKNGVKTDNGAVLYKIKAFEKELPLYRYSNFETSHALSDTGRNKAPDSLSIFCKPFSLVEIIKFAYQGFRGGNPKYYILPPPTELEHISHYIENTPEQKNPAFHSFIDSTKQQTRITIQVADIGTVRMHHLLATIKPRLDSIFDPSQYDVKITGNSVIFLKGNDYLLFNLQESLLLAIVLIAIIMFMLFMSGRMILVSIIPSLIPLLITAGLMGFFHIHLKPSTILIFSIAFGISSDGTMYFLTKYRQELKQHNGSISRTVSKTIKETGVSMIYTAIILFSGFSIFAASTFGGTAALGILVSLTLLIAYASNLILLPAILLSLEHRLTTKAFLQEPLIDVYDEDEDIDMEQLQIRKNEKP